MSNPIVYNADGSSYEMSTFGLKEYQHAVGGRIEIVKDMMRKDMYFVVNENGLMERLPTNLRFPQFVGNVIHVHEKDT